MQIVVSAAAAGWIFLEVINSLVDRSVLPNLVYKVLLVWYLGGLIVSVIVGWYHGEKGHQKTTKPEILMLVVVGILVLAGSGATLHHELKLKNGPSIAEASAAGLDLKRIAVLYFEDQTPDRQSQALADGLTNGLIQELARVNSLDVISENGAEQFRGSDLSPDSIARALRVGTLVDGSVERRGDKLRVNVQLIDGASGATFKTQAFEEPASDVGRIRDELSTEVSRILRQWLGEEVALQRQRSETTSDAAWLLVQRADRALKRSFTDMDQDHVDAGFASLDAADSLLAEASRADPKWVEPLVLRGRVAYRRSRWLPSRPDLMVQAIDTAIDYEDRALQMAPGNPQALEVRGTTRYWRFLTNVDDDPAVHRKLLEDARNDLESATRTDPSLAEAYSVLSSLYYHVDDVANAVLAARSAYQQDAYLRAANDVLWRLFLGSYDLEQFDQARRWCDEGTRRFGDYYRFAECHLWIMTTPGSKADPDSAWYWLARVDSTTPEPLKPYESRRCRMVVGGILARAGLADSARDVLVSARGNPQIDPHQELLSYEAFMRTLVGDTAVAISLLQQYVAANPGHEFLRNGSMNWWYRGLRDKPGFQAVMKTGH